MFPNLTDNLAGAVLMGLDVAVEFATLGEFRLVDPALAAPAPAEPAAAPMMRRPERTAAIRPDHATLPRPATAAARASAPDLPLKPRAKPAPPSLAVPASPRRRGGQVPRPVKPTRAPVPPVRRTRAGAVQPATQLCLAV